MKRSSENVILCEIFHIVYCFDVFHYSFHVISRKFGLLFGQCGGMRGGGMFCLEIYNVSCSGEPSTVCYVTNNSYIITHSNNYVSNTVPKLANNSNLSWLIISRAGHATIF